MLDYKCVIQSWQRVVRIQSALCEVACEKKNSRGLNIAVVKILIIVRAYENRSVNKCNE